VVVEEREEEGEEEWIQGKIAAFPSGLKMRRRTRRRRRTTTVKGRRMTSTAAMAW
jgi:hypothetical protein